MLHRAPLALLVLASLPAVVLCTPPARAQTHTHGDMVGSLRHDSAIVWTRASSPALASVLYGTSPTLAGALETAAVNAPSTTDFTAKVPLAGLASSTRYYYATRLRNPSNPSSFVIGPIGSFHTAPPPGTRPAVTFLVSADVNDPARFSLFRSMAAEGANFYVHLGDMPYADGARTIPEYWAKHKAIRNHPDLWNFFRSTSVLGIWDDHEVINNWDANTDPVLVANGKAVWVTYFPIQNGLPDVYRSFSWGDSVEVFVLDTRTYRGVNSAPDLPQKELLGPVQTAWLQQRLRASTALFKVIASSIPVRYASPSLDNWEGYMHARARIFDFVATERIPGVVVISADQHWAGSYQHREGMREFQFGPLATGVRAPRAYNDPEVRWLGRELNYGLLAVDPQASPPTMTVEWHGVGGLLRREVIEAGDQARAAVAADTPEAAFALVDGPYAFRNSGASVRLPIVPPGTYRAEFNDVLDAQGRPADLDVVVPGGADVRLAADYRDLDVVGHQALLADGFDLPLAGYTVHDEGSTSGPSSWFTDNGYLYQSSNIYTSTSGIDHPGTTATRGDPAWRDYTMAVRAMSHDNDGFGVVFRYQDPNNYYRFALDKERGFRRLVSRKNGAFRLLAEDTVPYETWRWYQIQAVAIGNRIRILVDGRELFSVADGDHARGSVGLYTWGNYTTAFDDLIVRAGDSTAISRPFWLRDDFSNGVLTGFTIVDQGTVNAPSAWVETGGVLQQTSNINDGNLDPRHVPKLGTMAIADPIVADHDFVLSVKNGDDDAIGAVFRYTDGANYYRVSMDAERTYRRLAKVVGGQWTVLWEDLTAGYTVGDWHRLHVRAVGDRIAVVLDGTRLAEVTDPSHPQGRVGLYCWGSDAVEFDDVLLQRAAVERPVVAAVLSGRTTTISARAPASAGRPYALALSAGRSPGIPLSLVNPLDPRVIELNADPLFFASLLPGPLFVGFQGIVGAGGDVGAKILWPPLPGLAGTVLYAGGWTISPAGRFGDLLPTVEIIVP